jgi:hypothetical protein
MAEWAMTLASRRGIGNQRLISQIATATMKLIVARTPADQVIPTLEQQFPQLVPKVAQPAPVQQQMAQVQPAPATVA